MAVPGTKENRFKVVAAIEIGTPFSTYVYFTTNSFQTDPLDIHQIKTWYSDNKRKGITKSATCLLLDRKLRFVSLGNDAQAEYTKLKHSSKAVHIYCSDILIISLIFESEVKFNKAIFFINRL